MKPPCRPSSDRMAIGKAWFLAWSCALGLYAVTAARGTQWVDGGYFILRIVRGELDSALGLALTHPLHYALGRWAVWLSPFEPATAITLVSAIAGAIAVANVLLCVLEVTGDRTAAWFAAGSLALANVFWHMSTLTEVYTLSAALLSAEIFFLIRFVRQARTGDLVAMLLFNGLGIANHMQAALTVPVLVVIVLIHWHRNRIRAGSLVLGVAVWMMASLPYSVLVGREFLHTGDLVGTLRSAVFGRSETGETYAHHVLNVLPSARVLGNGLIWLAFSFPNLLIPLAIVGLRRGPSGSGHDEKLENASGEPLTPPMRNNRDQGSPNLFHALLAMLFVHAVFVLRYNVVDQHTFLLPTLVLLSLFGGFGMAVMNGWQTRFRRSIMGAAFILLALTPVVYAVTPTVARHAQVLTSVQRHKPYRDDYRYLFWPWAVADRSAPRMSREAVELAGPQGLILAEDPMGIAAIQYQAHQQKWTGMGILLADRPLPWIEESMGRAIYTGVPIVLVPRDVRSPKIGLPMEQWERRGDLYLWKPKIPRSSSSLPATRR